MTKQRDETSNVRKFSGFGQNDFTVSRNWGGRHPQKWSNLKKTPEIDVSHPSEATLKISAKNIHNKKKLGPETFWGGSLDSPPQLQLTVDLSFNPLVFDLIFSVVNIFCWKFQGSFEGMRYVDFRGLFKIRPFWRCLPPQNWPTHEMFWSKQEILLLCVYSRLLPYTTDCVLAL